MCLARYVTINGVKAFTLFDLGSTMDAMSPDFTRVAKLKLKELVKPVTLQLGCSGSRSKVNFATTAITKFSLINRNTYLDIANLDKYDCILGTPFLRKHGISLDFERQEIVIRGRLRIPLFLRGRARQRQNLQKDIKNDYKEDNLVYRMWTQLKLSPLSPDVGR